MLQNKLESVGLFARASSSIYLWMSYFASIDQAVMDKMDYYIYTPFIKKTEHVYYLSSQNAFRRIWKTDKVCILSTHEVLTKKLISVKANLFLVTMFKVLIYRPRF